MHNRFRILITRKAHADMVNMFLESYERVKDDLKGNGPQVTVE